MSHYMTGVVACYVATAALSHATLSEQGPVVLSANFL
jgi:hypothetical protein